MKILVDVRSMGSNPSGIGIYAYNFIRALNKHTDLEIALVSDVAESVQIQYLQNRERVTLYIYGKTVSKTGAVLGYFNYIQKVIDYVRPDVFWEVNNLIPVKLCMHGGKTAVTIHDVFPLYMPECYTKIYPLYYWFGLQQTMYQADAILYDSEETKKQTEKYFPRAKKIRNLISYIVVEIENKVESSDLGFFLYIGNLEKRKGTDLLLNAYCAYRQAGGKKRLLLAGKFRDAKIEESYNNISREIDGIEYLGYTEEDRKEQLLSQCSCFVFPTRAEGFGIPAVEALIRGKPIILSNLPIFDELLDNPRKTICLQGDSVENLKQAMLDEKQWFRCNAKEMAGKFSADVLGQKVHDFFFGLV